jgi:hypothetical protein
MLADNELFGQAPWFFNLIGLIWVLLAFAVGGYRRRMSATAPFIVSLILFSIVGAFAIGPAIHSMLPNIGFGGCPWDYYRGNTGACIRSDVLAAVTAVAASTFGTIAMVGLMAGLRALVGRFRRGADERVRAQTKNAGADKLSARNMTINLIPPSKDTVAQEPVKHARIFISYRREGDAAQAGRIADRLGNEFGSDHVFMDVDAIGLGVDFVEEINKEVAKCDVLLAIIGPKWLELLDTNQDNFMDFVRLEIAAALDRKIPVIPILVDGTKIPPADKLPKELQGLARRNALNLRHDSFRADMEKLVRELKASKGS